MINVKNSFFFLGNAIGQGISLITAVFVLKAISPEEFGVFSIFTSLGSIIGSVATLKFELSIAISSSLKEAYEKLNLSIIVSFFINIFLISIISPLLNLNNAWDLILLCIYSICISFSGSIQQILLYREQHIKNGALSIMTATFNLVFILYVFEGTSLLIKSSTYSVLLSVLCLFILMYISGFKVRLYNFSELKRLLKPNIEYPKYILPGTLAVILLTYIHPILLALTFDHSDVGVFSFSLRILLLPVIIISSVASGLLRSNLSKFYFNDERHRFYREVLSTIKLLFIASAFSYAALILVIYHLDFFLDVSKWKGLEETSLYLMGYCLAQFFYTPLTNIAMVLGYRKKLLNFNLLQLILTMIVYILTYSLQFSYHQFLILLSSSFFIFALYTCANFYSMAKLKCN